MNYSQVPEDEFFLSASSSAKGPLIFQARKPYSNEPRFVCFAQETSKKVKILLGCVRNNQT